MRNVLLLLFILLIPSLMISAGNANPYSKQKVREQFNGYFKDMKFFAADIENAPIDFVPEDLIDFEEFIVENPQEKVIQIESSFSNLIEYLKGYDLYYGADSFQNFVDTETDKPSNLPICFKAWYKETMFLVSAALRCSRNITDNSSCIAQGVIDSFLNLKTKEKCLKETY